jgi:hypothetical protein
MGMVQQVLAPGMQHRKETDLGAEMPWIGRDLHRVWETARNNRP